MKFIEAFEHMANGGFCRASYGKYNNVYRLTKDSLELWLQYSRYWTPSGVSLEEHFDNISWEVCEDPEKTDEMPLNILPSREDLGNFGKWMEAVKVMIGLKLSNGAIAQAGSDSPYFICERNGDQNGITALPVFGRDGPLNDGGIYFMFKTKEDAESAIESIGKEKIVKMYKTFSGTSEGDRK